MGEKQKLLGVQYLRAFFSRFFSPEPDQKIWKREATLLATIYAGDLSEDDLSFVRLMRARVKSGLPILKQHGRRLDEIGSTVQVDRAW